MCWKKFIGFTACIYIGGLWMGFKAFGLEMVVWMVMCYIIGGLIMGIKKMIRDKNKTCLPPVDLLEFDGFDETGVRVNVTDLSLGLNIGQNH
jgi:hypothetical protein